MGIISVVEVFKSTEGTGYSIDGDTEYRRFFDVKVDNNATGVWTICNHPLLPAPDSYYISGDASEYDPYAILLRKSAKRKNDDDWQYWTVTCEYGRKLPDGGGAFNSGNRKTDPQNENPENEYPDVEWDYEVKNLVAIRDYGNPPTPYLNSSGVAFKPAPTEEVYFPVLTISRNLLYFDEEVATDYAGAVNADHFLERSAGSVKCAPMKAKLRWRGSFSYWRVSFRFAMTTRDRDGNIRKWDDFYRMLDEGTHELVDVPGGGKKLSPIFVNGTQVTQPVLLDGSGKRALPNNAGIINPTWLSFVRHRPKSFQDLWNRGPQSELHYEYVRKLIKRRLR